MLCSEAVLMCLQWDVGCEVGEDDFFKGFGYWGQKGYWSVGGALFGVFIGFGNGYYFGQFPGSRDCVTIEGDVVDLCEEFEGQ